MESAIFRSFRRNFYQPILIHVVPRIGVAEMFLDESLQGCGFAGQSHTTVRQQNMSCGIWMAFELFFKPIESQAAHAQSRSRRAHPETHVCGHQP